MLSTSDNHRQAALTALVAQITPIEQTAALPEKTQRELAEQHDVLGMLGQSPSMVAAGVICEESVELSWSGDSRRFPHAQYWAQKDIQCEYFFKASCSPLFFISIAGPWIVTLGTVFPTLPIVQRLTDYLWLGNSRANDDDHALACVFQLLRLTIDVLEQCYEELELRIPLPYEPLTTFPT
ncbi:hypothetical protein ARMSODRAFT_1007593 [Armillaria solidipes]|uniref:Uncharacterized protein n=1 Tax=Armillaria solidipes TaxID=1076256 RepID=A0A2H3B9C4_9AGAR|nr:hypothetical protein ARMSODRAFT_1007593 [Armillaria solidipes]